VLDVVSLCPNKELQDEQIDRENTLFGWVCIPRASAPVRLPFGDQAGVFFVAFGRIVWAEVMVLAVDGDDGTIPGLVETVRRLTRRTFGYRFSRHSAATKLKKRYMYRFSRTCCRTAELQQVPLSLGLGYVYVRAGNGTRTRDIQLGKNARNYAEKLESRFT
jgi:hypothetical protein